jgi:hypothetical protein
MRDRDGLAPPQISGIAGRPPRVAWAVICALALGIAAAYVAPRGLEADALLAIEDDPVALADRALDRSFDAALATREIEAALAAGDADLASSFVELAQARQIALDPALTARVAAAVADAGSASHAADSFARGLFSGEPDDVAGLAGTALGDLFVFGDIRDAVREGVRYAKGEPVDQVVLGLACVGLAITAGTYATLGAGGAARVGLSVAKAARKTGRLSADLTQWIGRSLRGVVDGGRLKAAISGASLAEPAVAMRAAREAVKLDRAGGLMRAARNVGEIQTKAGTRAALDALKIAESPRELARVAKLAEKSGGKTRAILKTVGRSAIVLSTALFDLGLWIIGALLTLLGFTASMKSATERLTVRALRRRKIRRLQRERQRLAGMPAGG